RACSSRPSANKTTPKKIGVQMARLNNPIFLVSLLEPDEIGHQHEHTDDHGQRVVVEVARLHPAHHTRGAAHQLPGAVHHEPAGSPPVRPDSPYTCSTPRPRPRRSARTAPM